MNYRILELLVDLFLIIMLIPNAFHYYNELIRFMRKQYDQKRDNRKE